MTETPDPSPPVRARSTWIRLALLLALLGAGALSLWWGTRPAKGDALRVLLAAPEPDPEANMSHYQARALALFLQDALESDPGWSVTLTSSLPEHPEGIRPGERWLFVKIHPRRQQDRLGLSVQWIWSHRWAEGPGAWGRAELDGMVPREVFRQALAALPLGTPPMDPSDLLPESTGSFWELVQSGTLRLQNADREEALRLARSVTQKEPTAAEGWFALGSLLTRTLLDAPASSGPDLIGEAEAGFRKGLALVPYHPRGTFQLAQLETDIGRHREALDLLLAGLKRHPSSPVLLTGLMYSARNAGLLELAGEASKRRDRWSFPEVQPLAIDVLALYTGDHARFEATLQDQPGHLRNSVQRFFRGYLALIRGNRAQAAQAFASAEAVPRGYPHYLRLARGFRLAAEGSPKAARETLLALELDRAGLRVPDGEFTLRVGEAFAAAGDLDQALELSERAFSQGFGALAWYEASPFLRPLHSSPRWRALMQHVRERQDLLKARFPVDCLPRE
jgi:tetratricopeptide (TPR) repeat protein